MTDVRLTSTDGILETAKAIADKIRTALDKDRHVLWLVSGGSAIAVATEARQLLGQLSPNKRLTVGMIDERFVPVGHQDSNWTQLLQSGFDGSGIQAYPMLEAGVNVEDIAAAYGTLLEGLLAQADYRIGLFGVGADGHTGGLLPHNPLMHGNEQLVGHFKGPDYERITVTPSLIHKLDDIIVFVLGQQKWPAITAMLQKGPIEEIPARVLTETGKTILFTDYKGDKA